jgi:DNA-binding PadR family transcriptional regulator
MEPHLDGASPDTQSGVNASICGEQLDVENLDGAHADLSGLCRDLLRVVAVIEYKTTAPPTGVKITEKIQEDYNRDVPHSVYNRLSELADRGLIKKQPHIGQTKLYTLTSDGKKVLRVYMEALEELLHVFGTRQFDESSTSLDLDDL